MTTDQYGVLLSSASSTVYPDLIGTIYDTLPEAIVTAGRIMDGQPGIETVLVQRPDPANPWRLLQRDMTAQQWLALRDAA